MSEDKDLAQQPNLSRGGESLTWRALGGGCALALGLGLWAGYAEMMIRSSPMANDFTASAALYILVLLLIGVHVPLRLLARRFAFTTAELATIYVLMLAAAAVPTRGFVEFLGPVVTGAQYYQTVYKWDPAFVDQVNSLTWVVPQGPNVVKYYYEGLATGESANVLTPLVGDADAMIPEYKAFLCDVEKEQDAVDS